MDKHTFDTFCTIHDEVGAYEYDYHELEEAFEAMSLPLYALTNIAICMDDDVARQGAKYFFAQSSLCQISIPKAKGAQQTTSFDALLNFT